MATAFFKMSRSVRNRSFSRRSREISAAGSTAECGADAGIGRRPDPASRPPLCGAAIASVRSGRTWPSMPLATAPIRGDRLGQAAQMLAMRQPTLRFRAHRGAAVSEWEGRINSPPGRDGRLLATSWRTPRKRKPRSLPRLSACHKSPRRQSSAATGRFRIRHRPLSVGVGNR
jgi:hypothetical protein